MFCLPADNCLEVLLIKDQLGVLSTREKQALAEARKQSLGNRSVVPLAQK